MLKGLGQIGDANLLVMAGLLLSDEMSDAYAEIEGLKEEVARKDKLLRQADATTSDAPDVGAITEMADRINAIAAKLEQA